MVGQTVLLKVVQGLQEGWQFMPMNEFLDLLDLKAWHVEDELLGIVLPQTVAERAALGRARPH